MNHLGIDYGSKLAGTTAIAYFINKEIKIIQSVKNKDADIFILDSIKDLRPKNIFIDAPLSLPLAYFNKGENYFYRECDQKLKAMSPMFLGGLTARAMRLKSVIAKQTISIYETYPKALVHEHESLKEVYIKKNNASLDEFSNRLKKIMDFPFQELDNWHQVDAVIAWWSGQRFACGNSKTVGNSKEGQIVF